MTVLTNKEALHCLGKFIIDGFLFFDHVIFFR